MQLSIGSDNYVLLSGLTNEKTGAYVNDATVTASVLTVNGATVDGGAISLSYIAASNGNYDGHLPNSLALTKRASYDVEVIATSGSLKMTLRKRLPADYYAGE